MGAARAGFNPQGQHLRLPPGHDLVLRHKTWADPVADEIGESLLLPLQRISHAAHIAIATLRQRFTGRETPACLGRCIALGPRPAVRKEIRRSAAGKRR